MPSIEDKSNPLETCEFLPGVSSESHGNPGWCKNRKSHSTEAHPDPREGEEKFKIWHIIYYINWFNWDETYFLPTRKGERHLSLDISSFVTWSLLDKMQG